MRLGTIYSAVSESAVTASVWPALLLTGADDTGVGTAESALAAAGNGTAVATTLRSAGVDNDVMADGLDGVTVAGVASPPLLSASPPLPPSLPPPLALYFANSASSSVIRAAKISFVDRCCDNAVSCRNDTPATKRTMTNACKTHEGTSRGFT